MNWNYWREWLKYAGLRSIRTFAQSMLAFIGSEAILLNEVNWIAALSAGGLGAVLSLLMALTGLPEMRPPDTGFHGEPAYTEDTEPDPDWDESK